MSTATKQNEKDSPPLDDARAELSEQIAVLRKDLAGLAGSLKTLTASGVDAASAAAQRKARAAGDAGAQVADSALEAAARNSERVADYAREKPLHALAIAAGAGLLIGYLSAPRR
ncbi:DUF883 family protein [Pikeienuella piscinae]|uniref:DUF883 family protein n=1 Tax=Pikeienuella piscinae TaxID=2748098 RepID=A0A7L5BXX0_9RHOB|nr:DUF883 family protein [Pikeienuella piscinae]QIE55688.1 DUF883 family protein [Pikeienuella piscinae]